MKNILSLTLAFTSTILFAQYNGDTPTPPNSQDNCSICACTPCCCTPKPSCSNNCCYETVECMECEAYSPPFYDLQCSWGISIDGEFLYWYAGETNLSYALEINAKPFSPIGIQAFSPSSYKYLGNSWDPGFRIGIGYQFDCSGWDSYLTWTWIRNSQTSSTSVPQFPLFPSTTTFALLNPWINQAIPTQEFDHISAKWRFTFNQIDWELGRKYWNSSCFALRPYIALRGAWWKTRFNTNSKRTGEQGFTGPDVNSLFQDKFTNRVWGVGFLGGLQPTWYFCSNFALYGNFDIALIWGDFKANKQENYLTQNIISGQQLLSYSNSARGEFSQMTQMTDIGIGLRWEETWCCDQFRTALDLGWEHHVLYDQNHRIKTLDSFVVTEQLVGFRTYDEATGNINMGGFVLRLHLDF